MDEITKVLMMERMLRGSLASAFAIAGFWGIWSFFAPVPVVTEIVMGGNWIIQLPFAMNRLYFDWLLAPIFVSTIIFVLYKLEEDVHVELGARLRFGLGAKLRLGLIFALIGGLAVGLIFGLMFGLAGGLIGGLEIGVAWLKNNLLPWLMTDDKKETQ